MKDNQPIPSPCVAVCQLDATGAYCIGCNRTVVEIAAWSGMTDAQRREVLARLGIRLLERRQ